MDNEPTSYPRPRRHHLDRRAQSIAAAAADAPGDELLTTRETADWLLCSMQWLEIGRGAGYGPPFVRIGPKQIRYRRADVLRWLEQRTHQRTAEYA